MQISKVILIFVPIVNMDSSCVLLGYVKSYIVLPSTIYGIASTALVDMEVQNPRSQQIPALVNASLDRKQGGMVGSKWKLSCMSVSQLKSSNVEGENRWPNVSISDGGYIYMLTLHQMMFTRSSKPQFPVTDLFILIFEAVLSSKAIGHGREGYYFGENGEHRLYDISKRISENLVELAKMGTAEPTTFTDAECQKYFGVSFKPFL